MTAAVTLDVRDLITGTGPFGPAEIARLVDLLGDDPSAHRDLKLAVADMERNGERSPASSVRLGVAQHLLGRHRDALATLRSADGSALAIFVQGRGHLALAEQGGADAPDHFAKAQESFLAARKAGYDDGECLVAAAEAASAAGDHDEARRLIANLDPAVAPAGYWALRGALLTESGGALAEAAAAFEKALERDPGHPGALFALGLLNDRAGNDDEAIACYERATRRFPASVGALVNLGILHEDRENYHHAQQCYRRVLQAFPDHPRARLFLKDSSATGDLRLDEQDGRQRDRYDHVLSLPVTDFELSVRSRNCLQKMGIMTLGDLARTSETELLESKNFGETSLVEIKEMLASKGLSLGQFTAVGAGESPVVEELPVSGDDMEILSQSITELALSVRARKCTTRLGITTIGELVRRTAEDLMECKNFGVTSLNEVREKLAERGLKLRGD
ncbi:MAG: tetratricopeptide repeat protein [Planctomycetes bacterium]|nr:tetratricopeptide repeat protein [Planctomycetota bacterium]